MKNKLVISLLALLAIVLAVFIYVITTGNLQTNVSYQKELQQAEKMSDSNEIEDIEKDINETDLGNIDAELDDIENELDAAVNSL